MFFQAVFIYSLLTQLITIAYSVNAKIFSNEYLSSYIISSAKNRSRNQIALSLKLLFNIIQDFIGISLNGMIVILVGQPA